VNINIWHILGIVFITLKLTGYIDWYWILVLGPFWMPYVMYKVIFATIVLIMWFSDNKKRSYSDLWAELELEMIRDELRKFYRKR
jgi:uncharacterized membrane protein YcgQ (UPF0703/DUF1980 family)